MIDSRESMATTTTTTTTTVVRASAFSTRTTARTRARTRVMASKSGAPGTDASSLLLTLEYVDEKFMKDMSADGHWMPGMVGPASRCDGCSL